MWQRRVLWRELMLESLSAITLSLCIWQVSTTYIFYPFEYKRVYLPLCEVPDTPFHIQGELCIYMILTHLLSDLTHVNKTLSCKEIC